MSYGPRTQAAAARLRHGSHTWLARGWQAVWAHRRRKAAILLLQSLSDRSLDDIGIHRSEIEAAVDGLWSGRQPAGRSSPG